MGGRGGRGGRCRDGKRRERISIDPKVYSLRVYLTFPLRPTLSFLSLNVVDADLAREEAKRRQDAVRRWAHVFEIVLVAYAKVSMFVWLLDYCFRDSHTGFLGMEEKQK